MVVVLWAYLIYMGFYFIRDMRYKRCEVRILKTFYTIAENDIGKDNVI